MRALIADVTLTSKPASRELRVGIRCRSGAAEEHTIERPKKRAELIRTPSAAVELTRRLAAEHANAQIAEQLNAAGLRTGSGRPFAPENVQCIGWRHKIPYPSTWAHASELPFPPEVEQQCREGVQNSVHLPAEAKIRAVRGAV